MEVGIKVTVGALVDGLLEGAAEGLIDGDSVGGCFFPEENIKKQQ